MYHTDLFQIYEKFNRDWFATYSFLNHFDPQYDNMRKRFDQTHSSKELLANLVNRGYIIRKIGKKIQYDPVYRYTPKGIHYKELWRISGKTIYELINCLDGFPEKMTDIDYADIARIKLIE